MVSAVSSQAATLNPLAYAAQTDDDTTKQAAPEATANDTDRGPATVVSFSQAAQDGSTAGLQEGYDRMAQVQAMSELIHRKFELSQINVQLRMLDQQDDVNERFTASLKSQQESLDKWMNTEPVPAVKLTDAQIADVLKKAAPLGIDLSKLKSTGADNLIFVMDGKRYVFQKDGTAWVNDNGVPTSEEEKQYVYQERTESMAYQATRIQDTSAARDALTAQINALLGQ